jgi:alkanesulfonate monooxygenase SsuD/methylene tetrahydromethanopterin reductase-like flavin-dependent oxidoreductase (luciferase family)
MYDKAQRENLSIRQLYMAVAAGNGHRQVIGTAAQIVDLMEEWFTNEAADGFNLLPQHSPGAMRDFIELVVPELQRRGLFRTEYEGATLRENLGVATPPSRYAADRVFAAAQ